jgi:hypothetical protein
MKRRERREQAAPAQEELYAMSYSHRNLATEQKEACQKVQQITVICEQLSLTLDPVDWQSFGMRAAVTVNTIKIADLLYLSRLDSASFLRRVQIKLLAHAALATMPARPDLKVVVWYPIEVVQPQAFLSLWILTLETDERIAIAEYLRNEQRIYEQYELDVNDGHQLAQLFGPVCQGEYHLGERVVSKEHERTYSGEIVYILPPGKAPTGRTYLSRVSSAMVGKATTKNEGAARYLIDCHDGFPHVVNQWQISGELLTDPACQPQK